MVKSGRMTPMSDMTGPGAGPAEAAVPRPPARKTLSWLDRWALAPLGLLWLAFLAILAIPVAVFVITLYYAVRFARALTGGKSTRRRGRRGKPEAPDQRVA